MSALPGLTMQTSVAYVANRAMLVTSGPSGVVHLWDVTPDVCGALLLLLRQVLMVI